MDKAITLLSTQTFTVTVGLTYSFHGCARREKATCFPHNSTGKQVLRKNDFKCQSTSPVHQSSPLVQSIDCRRLIKELVKSSTKHRCLIVYHASTMMFCQQHLSAIEERLAIMLRATQEFKDLVICVHFTEVSNWLAAQCRHAVSVACYQKVVVKILTP